jgi:iron complex outermembrane recepter protein
MSFQIKTFKSKLLSVSIAAVLLQQSGFVLAQVDGAEAEEVVITGIRGATKNAIDIKRNADSVVDAISATDIGKLPDATIADSLQRVTGVQITRSGGEGAGVNIRGNSNVTTTLNGEQLLSAGSITTVSPNFADIPSTMVSGIEVFKSASAKNVVSGLAGTVNLKTNRPFLLNDGFTAVGKIEAAQGALGKQTDGTFSGFFGYNNDDKFGASINISKGSSYLADYWNGSQGGEPGQWSGWRNMARETSGYVVDNVDVNNDGDTNDVFYSFEGHQAANRFIERDRTGVNGSIQFKINDALELTGDVFYTKLDEHVYTAAFVAEQAWQSVIGWANPDVATMNTHPNITHDTSGNVTVQPGNLYTMQSALWQTRLMKTQNQTIATDKEALNTNVELSYDNGGAFTGKLRWIRGEAINDLANSTVDSTLTDGSQINDRYRPAHGTSTWANPWGYGGFDAMLPNGTPVPNTFTQIPTGINYYGGKQNWTLPSKQLPITNADGSVSVVDEVFGSNLNRYSPKSANVTGTYTNADLNIFRFDGNYKFDSALFNTIYSIDFGARRGERNVAKDGWIGGLLRTNEYGDAFVARWKDTVSPAPGTGESYVSPISFTALNEKGMIKGISDFYGTTGIGKVYFIDPKAMDNPLAWHEKIYGPHILVPDAANVYDINDITTSFFVQANLEHDIFGKLLKGNVGLRYIETEYTIQQSVAGSALSGEFNGQTYLFGPGMVAAVGDTITAVNSYNDFLPAINLSLDLSDEQVLRFAFTKSIGTHNTDSLGGGLNVNRVNSCNITRPNGGPVACASSGSQNGNPALLPNRQYNADLSYEWYFSDSSMLSVGVFWVQGLTKIENQRVPRYDIVDDDGIVRGYDPETGKFNGYVLIDSTVSSNEKGDATKGLELGYKQSFDFLPGIWSGFGVDANFTYSPSTGSDVDYYGKKSPGVKNSEYQSNLALWYEKDGLQARIAHNFRSKMYMGRTIQGEYVFAYYQKPTNYIDASLSYEFIENMTVSLQMTNITQEHQELYNQWETNVDSRFYNERRTTLGLQVKY